MRIGQFTRSMLTITALAALTTSAMAATSVTQGSDITLEVQKAPEADVINVVVPAELPIVMDSNGKITVPTVAAIENKSVKPVKVVAINADVTDWIIGDFDTDYGTKPDDTKELALQFRGDNLQTDGQFKLTPDKWVIQNGASIDLEMQAKLAKQTKASNSQVANIEFTIDWVN